MIKKVASLLLVGSSLFAMHNGEININEKDLEFGLKLDMGQYNRTVEPDTTFLGIKYLKASEDNSLDENDNLVDIKYFVEVNFMIKQEVKHSGLKVGLGVKSNVSKVVDKTFMSVPLGLDISYELPLRNFIPIEVGGQVYYAPQSLSFYDAANFFEYRIGLEAEVIPRGSIIMGYREINTNYDIGNGATYDIVYNRSGYFGFKFEF